jgi:hypothetical protein
MDEVTVFSDAIMEDMERVRQSGFCNMFMRQDVRDVADALCCAALASWFDGQDGERAIRAAYPKLLTAFSAWKREHAG